MPTEIVNDCVAGLISKNLTIAFAESASAGRLHNEFAQVIDSGKILLGSLVCYDSGMKEKLLGIPASLIEKYSPESPEVTKEMAVSLQRMIHPDVSVAITGLTSPGGSENAEKPVGTVFVQVITAEINKEERFHFSGSPEEIVLKAIDAVSKVVLEAISGKE